MPWKKWILNIYQQEFIGDLIELLYSYEYIDSFRKFFHEKLPDRGEFFSSLKDECISEKIIYVLLMFGLCSN